MKSDIELLKKEYEEMEGYLDKLNKQVNNETNVEKIDTIYTILLKKSAELSSKICNEKIDIVLRKEYRKMLSKLEQSICNAEEIIERLNHTETDDLSEIMQYFNDLNKKIFASEDMKYIDVTYSVLIKKSSELNKYLLNDDISYSDRQMYTKMFNKMEATIKILEKKKKRLTKPKEDISTTRGLISSLSKELEIANDFKSINRIYDILIDKLAELNYYIYGTNLSTVKKDEYRRELNSVDKFTDQVEIKRNKILLTVDEEELEEETDAKNTENKEVEETEVREVVKEQPRKSFFSDMNTSSETEKEKLEEDIKDKVEETSKETKVNTEKLNKIYLKMYLYFKELYSDTDFELNKDEAIEFLTRKYKNNEDSINVEDSIESLKGYAKALKLNDNIKNINIKRLVKLDKKEGSFLIDQIKSLRKKKGLLVLFKNTVIGNDDISLENPSFLKKCAVNIMYKSSVSLNEEYEELMEEYIVSPSYKKLKK